MSKTTLESIRKTLAKLERQVAGYEHGEDSKERKARTRYLIQLGGIVVKHLPQLTPEYVESFLAFTDYRMSFKKDRLEFNKAWRVWREKTDSGEIPYVRKREE